MVFIKSPCDYFTGYKIRVSVCQNDLEKIGLFSLLVEASASIKNNIDSSKDSCFTLSPEDEGFCQLLDKARVPLDKEKEALELLERARDKGVLIEVCNNAQIYAFPHILECVTGCNNASNASRENGKKGGRPPKAKPTEETDSVPEDTPYSFRTKNGVEALSEEQIKDYQSLFPSINVRKSLERFKSWCEKEEREFSTGIDYFLKNTWFENDVEKQKNPSFTTTSYRGAINNRPIEPNPDIITEEAGF